MRADHLAQILVITPGNNKQVRGVLGFYLSYRLLLAIALTLFLFTNLGPSFLGSSYPVLYSSTVIAYLLLALFSIALCQGDLVTADVEYTFAILVDSAVIALLTYTSGGTSSGLGMLLGISIAFAGLGITGRIALLSAALASMAMLAEAYYAFTTGLRSQSTYTQVAMLGLSYFALSLLARELSNRAVKSEKLAQRQGIDIANLTELNEYIIQQMPTGIMVLDHQQHIRLLNDAAWSILGTPDHAVGHPLKEISSALDHELSVWLKTPSSRMHNFHAIENGEGLLARFATVGETDHSGTLIFLQDASEASATAQQIKLASLGRLTASIAHEIRNPLGALSHANQLLAESENLQGMDRRMTEIIDRNTWRLNQVIENTLALSRRTPPHLEPVILQPWLGGQVSELINSHALSPEQLELNISPADTTLKVDRKQLSQIIHSLVGNAIKHFDRPKSELRLILSAGIDQSTGRGYMEIADNGPGIPRDAVEKIFDPFFTTRNDGTGLGLYIARELCEMNNIGLAYLPSPVGGSCFKLKFQDTRNQEQTL
jgi:two-component system sensor histidine kinase PilS (NtrC family)